MPLLNNLTSEDLIELLSTIEEISASLDSQETLKHIMSSACGLLNADGASVFLTENNSDYFNWMVATNLDDNIFNKIKIPKDKGIVGYVYRKGKLLNLADVTKSKNFYRKIDDATKLKTKSCLTVPLFVEDKKIGVVQVINKKDGTAFNKRDEILLTEFSKIAGIVVNKAQLHKQIILNEKLKTDLELASLIQKKLLPKHELSVDGITIKGFYKPARYVSGDYYDYFKYFDDEIFFVIGDVSGKGAQASLLMASLKAFINSMCESNNTSLAVLANKINRYFYSITAPDKFITLFIGTLNTHTYKLSYVNAGHEKPLLLDRNRNIVELEGNELIIGIDPDYKYTETEKLLNKGDTLIAFTDGVTDAMDEDERMFGLNGLTNSIKKADDNFYSLYNSVIKSLSTFIKSTEQFDDITYLVLRIN